MAIEKVIDLKVNSDDAVKNIKKVDKEVQNVDESTQDLTSSLDKMTGGMISGFKNAVGGVRKGVIAMKSLKVAIAATGVGLLVIAIGSLVTFFTKTERGGRQLEIVFAQLGAAIDVIIDRVSQLGEFFSNIFSQPFSDSISDLTDTFAGMGDELEREIRLAGELAKATQEITDKEIDLLVVNAERRRSIAEDKLISKDRTLALDVRIAALKRALATEDEILISERVIQAERFRIAASEVALGESTTEDRRRVQEEQARLIDLTTASLTRQKEVTSELQGLLAEADRGGEDGAEPRDPITGLTQTDLDDLSVQNQVFIDDSLALVIQGNKTRNKIEKENAAIRAEIAQEEAEAKMAVLTAVSIGISTLSDVVGRETAEGKALAIASSLINTYQGITLALASFPGPVGIAFAAVTGLAGFAAVKKIAETPVPNSGGASPSVSIPSTAAVPSSPSFNIVGTSPESQLADTISTQQQTPVQAFVVGNDVTTQQELDRNIVQTATFGG